MCCQDGETLVHDSDFLSMDLCLFLGLHLELGTASSPRLPNNMTAMWGNGLLTPLGRLQIASTFW